MNQSVLHRFLRGHFLRSANVDVEGLISTAGFAESKLLKTILCNEFRLLSPLFPSFRSTHIILDPEFTTFSLKEKIIRQSFFTVLESGAPLSSGGLEDAL